jgi:hypothetical protein
MQKWTHKSLSNRIGNAWDGSVSWIDKHRSLLNAVRPSVGALAVHLPINDRPYVTSMKESN